MPDGGNFVILLIISFVNSENSIDFTGLVGYIIYD